MKKFLQSIISLQISRFPPCGQQQPRDILKILDIVRHQYISPASCMSGNHSIPVMGRLVSSGLFQSTLSVGNSPGRPSERKSSDISFKPCRNVFFRTESGSLTGYPFSIAAAIHSFFASSALATASSTVFPTERHPGRSGKETTNPPSSISGVISIRYGRER